MTAAGSLLVSAVLCARDDEAERLRSALESLCGQTLGRDAFEVVVVDDGSAGGIEAVARAFQDRLPVRWSRQRAAGLASARNHGLLLARGGIVLFLDPDASEPDLLRHHLEAHRRFPEPRYAVLGRTVLDASIADDPLMRFVHEAGAFLLSEPGLPAETPLDWSHFRAGRSSCKREFLLERGIFAAAFRSTGGEAELAYRLSRRGFQVVHEPAAVTRIGWKLGVDAFCARMRRQGRADALLARLHPEAAALAFADAAGVAEAWREIEPVHGAMLRSARELDRLVRLRREHGAPEEEGDRALLHRSYWAAFQASRVKGAVEAAAEGAREA